MVQCVNKSHGKTNPRICFGFNIWLVETNMFQPTWKNISQIGNLPQIGVKIKHIWNHHLDILKLNPKVSVRTTSFPGAAGRTCTNLTQHHATSTHQKNHTCSYKQDESVNVNSSHVVNSWINNNKAPTFFCLLVGGEAKETTLNLDL